MSFNLNLNFNLGVRPASTMGPTQTLPTDIANNLLWLDASDASSLTESAGAVSQWSDKSGNDYHFTQASGTSQPTTGAVTLNGLNVLAWDGDDTMDRPGGNDIFTGTGALTMLGVFREDASGSGYEICYQMGNNATRRQAGIGKRDTIPHYQTNGTDPQATTLASDFPDDEWGLLIMRRTSDLINDTTLYVNGGAGEQFSGYGTQACDVGSDFATIGGRGGGRLYGEIAEFAIWSGALSDADLNAVGSSIASKWGLTWTDIT